MASVTFTGLTKRFGSFTAVDALDLRIHDGEFCVLVGPSGCGKTTALRLLAGLETPSGGTIHLGARDVTGLEAKDRNIAMVFQNYALYPHMTVAENMGFALRMQGAARDDIRARVRRAGALLEIEHLLDRLPRQLSGGQRQRVAVGRAIVRDPEAFLFDEPLSNLDAKLRNTARTELRELQRRLGTTTVYVTHDQVEAMTMADRIVVMNDGRAEQIGAPLDIYDDPATVFVAGFLGAPPMNLVALDALAPAADDPVRAALAPLLERLPGPVDDRLLIGMRPERCRLEPPARASVRLQARVAAIEQLGAEAILLVDRNGRRLAVRLATRPDLPGGGVLDVYVGLDHVQVFHPDTRRRLRPEPAAAAA